LLSWCAWMAGEAAVAFIGISDLLLRSRALG
jgi:hypothetical protein